MSLQPGQQLLHYRIVEQIGEGGMGVVWKAVDTTLNREVAIKVLPPMVAQDAQRLARFDREAKLLASLNHANIASVFGLHEDGEIRFLVMEFVEGEDLLKRLERGRMSLEEALGMARQIADALQSAHERGVVHRDLKPANILITPEGKAKVLDFGLAKAFEPDAASQANPTMSPTLTSQGTIAGMILGTAGYMSPEQARGDPADKRSDVWAFGVVLYEMLGGRRAFHGDTVSDTLASVLKLEPDWNLLPGDLPRGVQRLLRRCLHKDPRQRLHDIADARIEIDEALAAPHEPQVAAETATAAPARTRWAITALLAVVALVVGLAIGRGRTPSETDATVRRFFLPLETLEDQAPLEGVQLSPDGRTIAYVFADKLWLRDLDAFEPRAIDGSNGASGPFWAPDSTQVGYLADDKLWRVPVGGGQPTAISDVPGNTRMAAWSTAQTIVLHLGEEIRQLSARGGESKTVHAVDSSVESDFHDVNHLPDGRGLVFVVHRKEGGADTLAVWSDGERKTLLQIEDAWLGTPAYSPTGHILFTRERRNEGVWALPFSLEDLEATGEPFLVVPDGYGASVSDDGTMVCTNVAAQSAVELIWVNEEGEVEGTIGQPQSGIFVPGVSPDGTKIAVSGEENDEWDIWVHDAVRRTKTRLTFTAGIEGGPRWSADGEAIIFFHPVFGEPKTIYRVAADGSGEPEEVVAGERPALSADGKLMVFVRDGGATKQDVWSMSLDPPSEPTVFLQTDAAETIAELSPDGRFVAYESDESGEQQIYVKSFPSGVGRWQASVTGGQVPHWDPSGNRLYFIGSDQNLMGVSFSPSPRVRLGTPELIVDRKKTPFAAFRFFNVAPDGRFVLIRNVKKDDAEQEAIEGIYVVENWPAEFVD